MKRILIVSDIHGELTKFENVLEQAEYNPEEDQLILLGDYIDRGPNSCEVMELIMELVKGGAIALKGNHEDLFIKAIDSIEEEEIASKYYNNLSLNNLTSYEVENDDFYFWIRNGGGATIDSYYGDEEKIMEHIIWMKKHLKLYHETEDYIFVHAGLEPLEPLEWQSEEVKLWTRHVEEVGLGKLTIHGHTVVKEVIQVEDQLFIDTGAAYGGKLTLLELPSMKIYEE